MFGVRFLPSDFTMTFTASLVHHRTAPRHGSSQPVTVFVAGSGLSPVERDDWLLMSVSQTIRPKAVEANCRPTCSLDAERQFESAWCGPPSPSVAVAHLGYSAAEGLRGRIA